MSKNELNAERDIAKIEESAKGKKAKKGKEGPSQGTMLWEFVRKEGIFVSDRTGTGYFAINGILYPIGSDSFNDYLSSLYYENKHALPGKEAISQVKNMANFKARKKELNIGVRVSVDSGKIIYDLVNTKGSVIEITQSGINEVVPKIPYTARFKGMQEAKKEAGTLEDLLGFLQLWNFTNEQRILIAGYIGASFIPDIPHAILVIIGPHGSGKSSLTSAIKTIVDPNVLARQSLKNDDRDIAIASLHSWVIPFDNVNSVMPQYISDALCRLATGEGFRTRQLYTDSDEVILSLKRVIIINAINEPNYAPDFLDRALTVSLKAIVTSRRTELEIDEIITTLSSRIRGFMLNLIPIAMKMYPNVVEEYQGKLPRMADFVIWAECVSRAMGNKEGGFFEAFKSAQEQEIKDTAQNDTLIIAIDGLMAGRDEWKGKSQDLLDELTVIVGDGAKKQLPKNFRNLGRKLKELEPTLRTLGYEISDVYDAELDSKHPVKQIKKLGDPKHGESLPGHPGESADPEKYDVGNHPESSLMKFNPGEIREDGEALKSDVRRNTPKTPKRTHMLEGLKDEIPKLIEGIIAELLKDDYHVHPDHSRGIGTTSNQYFITVLKAGAENRFAELKEKLQKYSFEYVNANRRGYLFSRDIKGDGVQ